MHNLDLIMTLTGGLTAALFFGYLSQRMGLSPIVGYLVGGLILGPYTPGFVADRHSAEQLAEVGVILLMFGVGLHFHLEELLAVRRVAVPGAIGQSLLATILGVVVAHGFGWDWNAGIVFGMALSVASTVVLVRVLSDNRDLHTASGHIAVGWLVVEDMFTVVALVLLPALFGGGGELPLPVTLALVIVKVALLVVATFVVGGRVVPWLLDRVAATRSRELFTLTVLAVALGIAVASAKLFGVSMALGAFLAGMVVGRSDFSLRAASEALPMRDAFAVLFFVSVGMLLDPRYLVQHPILVGTTLAVILIGKPLIALVIVLLLRYPTKSALSVSVALAQIGEFSFILATQGEQLNVLTSEASQALVAASIFSISLNPILYRQVDRFDAWASRNLGLWRWLNRRNRRQVPATAAHDAGTSEGRHRAVVIGYGPIGRTVTRLLRENEVEPTIIELNMATVRRLRASGLDAIYGDAAHRDTLVAAGVPSAGSLILSSAGMSNSEEVIRVAKELNPNIHVLARANFLQDRAKLLEARAEEVFSSEGEVALAFAAGVLRRLGATPEQIDRERQWVYADLLGQPLVVGDGLDSDEHAASATEVAESTSSDEISA